MYNAIRRARPQVDWDSVGPDITTRRGDNGKAFVMIVEDTPAATAIREAMDAVEDF
jgi:hypothetical protein